MLLDITQDYSSFWQFTHLQSSDVWSTSQVQMQDYFTERSDVCLVWINYNVVSKERLESNISAPNGTGVERPMACS